MTFLAPQFLWAALAVGLAVAALHFLASQPPRAGVLPTARFVPHRRANAIVRAATPSDLLLMLLRVALVLAVGLGLSRPVPAPTRRADVRIILADASRAVRDVAAIRAGVRSVHRDGDVVIVFDSAARPLTSGVSDTLERLTRSRGKGSLSGALVAALGAAATLSAVADSLELVIVSPLAAEERDAATGSIRRLWPGGARLIRIGAAVEGGAPARDSARSLELRGSVLDPLSITVSRTRAVGRASALIIRDDVLAPASAPEMLGGRALVRWPRDGRPLGAIARSSVDTTGGVIAGEAVVVAPFARRWSFPRDSIPTAQVIARWTDGEPAVVEWMRGAGCERSVAIPVSAAGDLVIRDDFRALVQSLGGSCSGDEPSAPMSASDVASLVGTGTRASHTAFQQRRDVHSWLAPWLLALALLLAVVELFLRRRRRTDAASIVNERAPGAAA